VGTARFQRRLLRRNKHYDPNKSFVIKHVVQLNEAFQLRDVEPGTNTVSSPQNLDFGHHANETLTFLVRLREELLAGRKYNVLIDLSPLEEISLPAAVVLLAEVSRCLLYVRSHKKIRGNYPKTDRAQQILADIGFFAAFGAKKPRPLIPKSDRVYVRTACGNQSDGRYTRQFLALFHRVMGLPVVASKRLYSALLECMDNVKSHAYDVADKTGPDTIGEWWLCGFADPIRQQLALVFYDLGVGIPGTIKRRRSLRFRHYLNFTDSKILRRAVVTGLSSSSSARRGTGLPSLREFVDVAPGGFLRVISGKADFTYERRPARISVKDIDPGIAGSLIVWTVQGSRVKSGAHDLADEPVQLSFEMPDEH
jgi:hypothetical protein